ncbi:MAG: preprotein translocase subunit YajC, partial [Planctomycetota bacterium]
LIFAPEKKARKQRQEMLDALKKGDKVVTTSGLHAEVAELRESDVVLKAGDSRFVYTRSAVAEVRSAKED